MTGFGGDQDTLTAGIVYAITPEQESTVRDLVRRRCGDDAAHVAEMLFATPHSVERRTPAQLAMGNKLPPEAKDRIRELLATGLTDVAIADQLGVSRQSVTGVRTGAMRGMRS
ncbi:hypothetical protein [Microbacterium sp.]|jgi:hypothetical protein|uniref:hypothetical protein n=1 Tax=Microbacterium sp. TaxID=51671 RepID=UPI0037C5FB2A